MNNIKYIIVTMIWLSIVLNPSVSESTGIEKITGIWEGTETDGRQISSPEEEGPDTRWLTKAVNSIISKDYGIIGNLTIVKNGKPIMVEYFHEKEIKMPYYKKISGPYFLPMIILSMLNIFLIARKVDDFFFRKNLTKEQRRSGLNAIFFWGAISAVIGFFSHYQGIFHAMTAISKAEEISHKVVASGYARSLTVLLHGMIIFTISVTVWFFLRWKWNESEGE